MNAFLIHSFKIIKVLNDWMQFIEAHIYLDQVSSAQSSSVVGGFNLTSFLIYACVTKITY